MQGTLLAVFLIVLPVMLVLFLRASAAMLFFVLAGAALLQYNLDKDVAGFASSLMGGSTTNTNTLSLLLLFVPFVVTAFAFRNSISKNGIFGHAILSICLGICLMLIATTYLPPSLSVSVQASSIYIALQPFTSFVIGITFLFSVCVLWIGRHKHEHHKHKKHGR